MPRSFHDQYAQKSWDKSNCLTNTHENARNNALVCTDLFRTLFCCEGIWDNVGYALGAMCALGNTATPNTENLSASVNDDTISIDDPDHLGCGDLVAYSPCLCVAYTATLPCSGVRGALEKHEFDNTAPSIRDESRPSAGGYKMMHSNY